MKKTQWMLYTKRADFNELAARFSISPVLARIKYENDGEAERTCRICGDKEYATAIDVRYGTEAELRDLLSHSFDAAARGQSRDADRQMAHNVECLTPDGAGRA